MKINQARGILSTVLILSGLLSLITGAVLYFMKYGMWLGFTRKFLNDTHAISGLVMCIVMMVHFFLNRHLYMMEMKSILFKKNK